MKGTDKGVFNNLPMREIKIPIVEILQKIGDL
jgi:hypothetical protein